MRCGRRLRRLSGETQVFRAHSLPELPPLLTWVVLHFRDRLCQKPAPSGLGQPNCRIGGCLAVHERWPAATVVVSMETCLCGHLAWTEAAASLLVKVKLLARFAVLIHLLALKHRHFASGLLALLNSAALQLSHVVLRWEVLLQWLVRLRL